MIVTDTIPLVSSRDHFYWRPFIYFLIISLLIFLLIFTYDIFLGITCIALYIFFCFPIFNRLQKKYNYKDCLEVNTIRYDYVTMNDCILLTRRRKDTVLPYFLLFVQIVNKYPETKELPFPFSHLKTYSQNHEKEFEEFCIMNVGNKVDISNISQYTGDISHYSFNIFKELYPDYKNGFL